MLNTDEKTEWRLEPTPEEIAAEMHEKCVSFQTAREKLLKQLRADAEHLESVMPSAADEAAKALDIAAEAKERVENLFAEKNAVLSDVEALALQLARIRWRISKIKELELSKSDEAALAVKALSCFLNATESPSVATGSAFTSALGDLAKLTALRGHIPAFVAGLQAKSEALQTEIIAIVSKNQINFGRLLDSIRKNPASFDAALLHFLPVDLAKK